MPAPTPQHVVKRLRELFAYVGVRQAARQVGVDPSTASKIKNGQRHGGPTKCVTLCSLGIARADGKLCRRCGESMVLKVRSGLCVECELFDLAKQGKVEIAGS